MPHHTSMLALFVHVPFYLWSHFTKPCTALLAPSAILTLSLHSYDRLISFHLRAFIVPVLLLRCIANFILLSSGNSIRSYFPCNGIALFALSLQSSSSLVIGLAALYNSTVVRSTHLSLLICPKVCLESALEYLAERRTQSFFKSTPTDSNNNKTSS